MFVNAVFVKLLGFRPLIMHAVPVFLYAVFILTAYFYIPREKDEVNGNAGLIFKTGLFLFIIFLVFPSRGLAFWALQEGTHLSAVIVCKKIMNKNKPVLNIKPALPFTSSFSRGI